MDATIATEDKDFYSNAGVDPVGIARAVVQNLTSGQVSQGASTLTQQLARNQLIDSDQRTAQTYVRKIQEAILATRISDRYTKDEILSQREQINAQLQHIIDEQTEPWGIKVSSVEIKDVELPQTMQRAMAKQAEAEREKRAKIIHAEGELQASEALAKAAHALQGEPSSMQLRYLQTLAEIATEKNSTIVFPVPVDILSSLFKR
jgi:regulator of protease activity HflC (stomatin/prohibitin superfamily)